MHGRVLRIGIDFDNTLVDYDDVFREVARRCGLVPMEFAGGKLALRSYVRNLPEGEVAWQRLQADVYGKGIVNAKPSNGAFEFVATCRRNAAHVDIVSHKTQYAGMDRTLDLRAAATAWLRASGLLDHDLGVASTDVYFASTREEKLARIADLGCTHFVDDLHEVLEHPEFPSGVRGYLLGRYTWSDIANDIFRN